MKWAKAGTYHRACPPYTISIARVRGEYTYTLWHISERLGTFDDASKARRAADRDSDARGPTSRAEGDS